jgi:hypothetical protein
MGEVKDVFQERGMRFGHDEAVSSASCYSVVMYAREGRYSSSKALVRVFPLYYYDSVH